MNAEEQEEPDKYLKKVDDVMSNLIHVVEHSSSRSEYMEFILNLPIFNSLKVRLLRKKRIISRISNYESRIKDGVLITK